MADYIQDHDELYHYGVPGMKWGVRKDSLRYAYRRGTEIARKVGSEGYNIAKKAGLQGYKLVKKAGKSTSRTLKRIGRSTATAIKNKRTAMRERKTNKILRSGNLKKIYRRLDKLTNDELASANKRLEMQTKIINNVSKNRDSTQSIATQIFKSAAKQSVQHIVDNAVASTLRGEDPISNFKRNAQTAINNNQIKNLQSQKTLNKLQSDLGLDTKQMRIRLNSIQRLEDIKGQAGKNILLNIKTRKLRHDGLDGDYLAHYGVLGMKWGVRKDPDRKKFDTYVDLNNYRERQKEKVEKYVSKQNKLEKKLLKKENKKSKLRTQISRSIVRGANADRLRRKQAKVVKKIDKIKRKQNKLSIKMINSKEKIKRATDSINKIKKELGPKKISDFIEDLYDDEIYGKAPTWVGKDLGFGEGSKLNKNEKKDI